MLIMNGVNLLGKDESSGQTVVDALDDKLLSILENYPKSKYMYSAQRLKRFEAQHSNINVFEGIHPSQANHTEFKNAYNLLQHR